ncbi:uncharacterized protein BP5553_03796 [Venustampulla echinocandica]|uniref:RING-type domain-containing protein n=1 Tax=Venustampulla echinocandica TaxID=2656787 RepID=A0A370TVA5_9HELO|nr:uncharacterized protein BP5553_03796 [Venustampulla echinocandica]RDL39456.1 hypothetical protein BP5553_03796 [Venustampulla echinocandica]
MSAATPDEIQERVQGSLKDGPYACSSLTKLSGGTANFVYRGVLVNALQDGSKTVIIKHTEGYVASTPAFKITSTRCEFEQSILTALQELPPVTHSLITVQTPKMYYFSQETNTQLYSDLPSSADLKTYALTNPLAQAQCSRLGHSLGLWTKTFHIWAAAPEQAELRETMKGNTVMRGLKYQINYSNLVATIDNFPAILEGSRDVFQAVAKDVQNMMDNEDGALIHGDFWSGNVLLPNISYPSTSTPLNVLVVDWELSHLSTVAFDLGQMFAELFELKHFKGIDAGIWLIESFMQGYGPVEEDLAFNTAIHVGTHLICWGSTVQGWGTKEQIEGVVEIGRGFVVKGWEKDASFFKGTALGSRIPRLYGSRLNGGQRSSAAALKAQNKSPSASYTSPPSDQIADECAICLNPLTTPTVLYNCLHRFDYACIRPRFLSTHTAASIDGPLTLACPTCRGEISYVHRLDTSQVLSIRGILEERSDPPTQPSTLQPPGMSGLTSRSQNTPHHASGEPRGEGWDTETIPNGLRSRLNTISGAHYEPGPFQHHDRVGLDTHWSGQTPRSHTLHPGGREIWGRVIYSLARRFVEPHHIFPGAYVGLPGDGFGLSIYERSLLLDEAFEQRPDMEELITLCAIFTDDIEKLKESAGREWADDSNLIPSLVWMDPLWANG